ncbi:MAG: hypothetical protein WBQ44_10275 [Rhodococcus sp. (in: high G+C Gram-positive bacteria)]
MTRIGFADHLFLRMHHGIGKPVSNQFLWLFDSAITREELDILHSRLAEGLLARAVVEPVLPTARHRWIESERSLPMDITPVAIGADGVRCWAEQRASAGLDPERGVGWQLAAAHIDGGSMVVSLVCSHMIADGAAMIAAIRNANTAQPRGSVRSAPALGVRPPVLRAIVDDVIDTAHQVRPILAWAAGKTVATLTRSRDVAPKNIPVEPRRSAARISEEPWSPPYVVVDCPVDEWRAVAAQRGGTSTSLFIGLMTALSYEFGRARPGDELRWSLPYSNRDLADAAANSTKIVPLHVTVPDPADLDLSGIRKASKLAYGELAARIAADGSTGSIPLQLVQMLPDAVVRRLPMPADGAEGLCSNLGSLPDDFVTIGGVRARSVSARATFVGADATFARTLGGGFTAWATETDEYVTVTLHGMDPDRMHSDDSVRDAVAAVLTRWSITHRFW